MKEYILLGWSRPATQRQRIANWYAFTDGDAPTPEIEDAINLTRVLAGPQYSDPETRSERPSYKAKYKKGGQ